MAVPSFEDWLTLSEQERSSQVLSWSAYKGEGETLVDRIYSRFREEYSSLPGLEIIGPGVYHGGAWVIAGSHPFVFDGRAVPKQYLGVPVRLHARLPLPAEFEGQEMPDDYVWSPRNYERFVDRCGDEVRHQLGLPDMSRAEMLDALFGGSFEEHVANCRRWVREGVIPPFE